MVGVSSFWQTVIKGVVIVVAVIFDQLQAHGGRKPSLLDSLCHGATALLRGSFLCKSVCSFSNFKVSCVNERGLLNMQDNEWIQPIPKKSLSKMVMNMLKDAIINGTIKPGDFLPSENELADKFNVGKSSIREAIKMLEAIGYVEICKGNGCRVRTSIDPDIINPLVFQLVLQNHESKEDLLVFRKTIETAANLLAMKNATKEDIQRLKDNLEKTRADLHAGRSTLEDDEVFHTLMYKSTHNPYLLLIGNTIMHLFHASLIVSNTNYPNQVLADHEAIVQALVDQDKERMVQILDASFLRWYSLSLADS